MTTTTRQLPDHSRNGGPDRTRPAWQPGSVREGPIELRPERSLLRYYLLVSLATGPAFPLVFGFLFFRFRSIVYTIDEEGITKRWGFLFSREVSLTFSRLQDIQVTTNFVERWLDLARIDLQTASGNAGAEMTIVGLHQPGAIRDFLYSRMRGAKGIRADDGEAATGADAADDLATTLHAVAREVAEVRSLLERMEQGRDGND